MVVHPATPLTWRTLIVPKSEKGADGVPMTPQEFKKECSRLLREIAEGEIANAISRWLGPVRIAFASAAVMLRNHKK